MTTDQESAVAALRPGQREIMRSFALHGRKSVYVASDILDLRVCYALVEKGVLAPYQEGDARGFELTDAGASLLSFYSADLNRGENGDR